MKYRREEIIDRTKDAALIETYRFKGQNHRIHTDNIKYVGIGTFDNKEIDNLPYINGETDVDIHIFNRTEYENSILANSSDSWPSDLNDDDKIAVIIINGRCDQTKKMTWDEYNASEQDVYLDEDNAGDLKRVHSTDNYEMWVHKNYADDCDHCFSGEGNDFIVVDCKNGESYMLYGRTLAEAISFIED